MNKEFGNKTILESVVAGIKCSTPRKNLNAIVLDHNSSPEIHSVDFEKRSSSRGFIFAPKCSIG